MTTSAQGPRFPMPMEPIGNANEAVFPAYEAWGESQDGSSYYIVLGYRNRNRTQTIEIPIGPHNRIEPGGPDYGQPTVFEPGRRATVFAIEVPKDFGSEEAHVDAGGQRSGSRGDVPPEPPVQHGVLPGGGERQRRTEDAAGARRSDDDRTVRWNCQDAHGNGGPAGAAQAVGVGCAAD